MLQPIALEEQARELLKAGDFDQALQLADVAAAEGAPWVEDAYAEAAFLLIHGKSSCHAPTSHVQGIWRSFSMFLVPVGVLCKPLLHSVNKMIKIRTKINCSVSTNSRSCRASESELTPAGYRQRQSEASKRSSKKLLLFAELRFREAVDALLRCSTTAVQPGELFPLFPEYTQPWANRKLHARQHWGIHPPLTNLHTLIERLDQSGDNHSGATENGNSSVQDRMAAAARQCVADYLLEVGWPMPAGLQINVTVQASQLAVLLCAFISCNLLTTYACGGTACSLPKSQCIKSSCNQQVRQWEGAEALDGIDTLLVHLLADADSAAALESFAAAPNEVNSCSTPCPLPCSSVFQGPLAASVWHQGLLMERFVTAT